MAETRIIIGLGNPGQKYTFTRHNCGFLVLERLAQDLGVSFKNSSLTKGSIAKVKMDQVDLYLFMPSTYMNNSGIAVRRIIDQKKCDLTQVLIVCDDFHLNYGQLRIRAKGRDGGHNGLASIMDHLGTIDFSRLRMGIGAPPRNKDVAQFVLESFKGSEKKQLDEYVDLTVRCVKDWMQFGMDKTMEKYNKKVSFFE